MANATTPLLAVVDQPCSVGCKKREEKPITGPVLPKPENASGRKPTYGIISVTVVPVSYLAAFVLTEIIRSGTKCATPLLIISLGTMGGGAVIALVTASVAIFGTGESRIGRFLGIIGVIASLATVVGVLSLFYRRLGLGFLGASNQKEQALRILKKLQIIE